MVYSPFAAKKNVNYLFLVSRLFFLISESVGLSVKIDDVCVLRTLTYVTDVDARTMADDGSLDNPAWVKKAAGEIVDGVEKVD